MLLTIHQLLEQGVTVKVQMRHQTATQGLISMVNMDRGPTRGVTTRLTKGFKGVTASLIKLVTPRPTKEGSLGKAEGQDPVGPLPHSGPLKGLLEMPLATSTTSRINMAFHLNCSCWFQLCSATPEPGCKRSLCFVAFVFVKSCYLMMCVRLMLCCLQH